MVAPSRYRSPPTYKIRQRDGRYLADPRIPFRWTAREMAGYAFRTRREAHDFIERNFVGEVAARELLGLRVV